jgi:hypothetical protein
MAENDISWKAEFRCFSFTFKTMAGKQVLGGKIIIPNKFVNRPG